MAWTKQQVNWSADTSLAFPGFRTPGSAILVACAAPLATDPVAPTDSDSNTYTLVARADNGSSQLSVWLALNAGSGAGTLTADAGVDFTLLVEFTSDSGVIQQDVFDTAAAAFTTATDDVDAGTVVTNYDGDLAVAFAVGENFSVGTGWTDTSALGGGSPGGASGVGIEHQTQVSAGSLSATFTAPASGNGAGILVALATPPPEVGFDVATESVRTGTTDPHTFTHTPVAAPNGVVLAIVHGTESTDLVTGTVSYGGVAMTRIVTAADTVTEPGRAYLYFLGSGIPTGAQTVSADLASATATDIEFVCITLTTDDAADLEVLDFDSISADAANPSVTLTYSSRVGLAVGALYGGGAAPTAFTPNANCQTVHDNDFGAFYAEIIRQTNAGSADFAIGGTAATDDVAFVAAAFAKVAAGTTYTKTTAAVIGP